jgi:hypothetical protein
MWVQRERVYQTESELTLNTRDRQLITNLLIYFIIKSPGEEQAHHLDEITE